MKEENFTYRSITPYTAVRLTNDDVRVIRRIRQLYLLRLLGFGVLLFAFGLWLGILLVR